MTMEDSPKPKRRWFQFSLRTLLVFVLIASIGMSWLAVRKERVRRQLEAVKAIQKAGGCVGYEEAETPVSPWLRELLADDFCFLKMHTVNFYGTQTADAGLEHLKWLNNLEHLELSGTQVTDAGLEHVKGLTNLEWLVLSGTHVTDAGLEHLKALADLQTLDLSGTHVTDAALEHLKALADLRTLDLSDTQVTGPGLEHLKGLTNLGRLDLSDTQVAGPGLEQLKELTNLGRLDLNGTQVTDAGLEHLKGLTSLRGLHLKGTQVTDAGVNELKMALPNCVIYRYPDLFHTPVTEAGLERFRRLTKLILDLDNTEITPQSVKKPQEALPEGEMVH